MNTNYKWDLSPVISVWDCYFGRHKKSKLAWKAWPGPRRAKARWGLKQEGEGGPWPKDFFLNSITATHGDSWSCPSCHITILSTDFHVQPCLWKSERLEEAERTQSHLLRPAPPMSFALSTGCWDVHNPSQTAASGYWYCDFSMHRKTNYVFSNSWVLGFLKDMQNTEGTLEE